MTEVRVMDMSRVMSAYGFKGGVFDYNAPVAKKMSNECDERVLGIEGDKDLVDSAEEFLTATYICPVKISYNAQKIVDKELPKGKEGALRLCSIWLKKVAEYPENSRQYWDAIAIVKEKAYEKYGITLTDNEISDYYAESMKKKIYETPIKLLTKDEQDKIRELLLSYLLNPTTTNAENFRVFVQGISGCNPKKGGAIVSYVEKISPQLIGSLV